MSTTRWSGQVHEATSHAVIPPLGRRTIEIAYEANAYDLRHRTGCFINKIKHCRRIAARFEKTARSFFSMLCLAAAMIRLR